MLITLSVSSKATTVEIYNRLGDGNDLAVHCQSKDDDLGPHVLPNSANFKIRFRPSWTNTTLFYCKLQWQGTSLTFDVYAYQRDFIRCRDWCYWEVRQQGVFGYNQTGNQDIGFPWN